MKKLLQYPQVAYVLVGLITFGVYANSLHNPFHYDDLHSIVDNPHVRDLGRIPSFFIDPTAFSAEADNAMYRPLLLATFAINYAISGYEVYSYHLVALGLHLGCVLLLGAVARQLLADQYAAYFAAALFALHPINTEPINYISSRSEILASFFFLLGLYAYLRPGQRRYLWVSLAFAGGVLSKSTTVVFPLVLVAYELICYRRLPRADKGLYALLAGVASLYLIMVWTFLKKRQLPCRCDRTINKYGPRSRRWSFICRCSYGQHGRMSITNSCFRIVSSNRSPRVRAFFYYRWLLLPFIMLASTPFRYGHWLGFLSP